MLSQTSQLFIFQFLFTQVIAVGSNPWIQIPWQTGGFGPDGPWHAVGLGVSDWSVGSYDPIINVYPYGGAYSWVFGKTATASLNKANDTTQPWGDVLDANTTTAPLLGGSGKGQFYPSPFGAYDWYTYQGGYGNFTMGNGNSMGETFSANTIAGLSTYQGSLQKQDRATFNTSLVLLEGNTGFQTPGNQTWIPPVGVWGLGGTGDNHLTQDAPYGATAEIKKQQLTGSESFGLTFGSVNPSIDPSLFIGAYDKGRVMGQVGVFGFNPMVGNTHGQFVPQITLVDFGLDAVGDSPIHVKNTSLWNHLDINTTDSSSVLGSSIGSANGSIIVTPNTAGATIQLPTGLCEAAASYLPVTFNADLGLYIWNSKNDTTLQIMKSSQHLFFTLQDINQANVTIKIPFQLLNLTMDKPVVKDPVQYFPCQPQNSTLPFFGRTFFQAAYLAVNYDQNITFIAQAPGPDVPAISAVRINSGDQTIAAGTTDQQAWANSWAKTWTYGMSSASNATSSSADDASNSGTSTKLSVGLGLGIGVPAVALVGAAGLLFWRRRRQQRQWVNGGRDHAAGGQGKPLIGPGAELDNDSSVKHPQQVMHEAPNAGSVYGGSGSSSSSSNNNNANAAEADGSPVQPVSEMDSVGQARLPPQEMYAGLVGAEMAQPISEMPGDYEWSSTAGAGTTAVGGGNDEDDEKKQKKEEGRTGVASGDGSDRNYDEKRLTAGSGTGGEFDSWKPGDDASAMGTVSRGVRDRSNVRPVQPSAPDHFASPVTQVSGVSRFTMDLASPRPESSVSVRDAARQER